MWKNRGERDAAEVRRVLAGDRDHFGVLVERYLPGVWAVASAHLHNLADAEDASQEAFVKAYVSLDKLRDPNHFSAWLMTIARNTARGTLRRRDRASSAADEMKDSEPAAIPDPAADDTRRLVRAHIDQLDPDFREALLLHYFAGQSSREMSRSLGISPAGARKRLQRARAALTASMTRELHELRPDSDRLRERKDAITKTVLAATAGWSAAATASTTVATAATWSFLPSTKLLGGAALGIAATIGLGAYLAQQADDRPTLAQSEPAPVAQQLAQEGDTESRPTTEPPTVPAENAIASTVNEAEADKAEASNEMEREPLIDTGRTNAEIDEVLRRPVGLVFENIHVTNLLEFVFDTFRIPIFVDAAAVYVPKPEDKTALRERLEQQTMLALTARYRTNGKFESIDIRDQTLIEALDELTGALGLAYISEPGFFWISSPDRIESETRHYPDERFERYEDEDRAKKTTSLVFDDIHIQEVAEFVTDTFEVHIVLDYRVIKPLNHSPSPLSGFVPAGRASDGIIPFLNLQDVDLRDALRAMLRPLNLDYRVIDGALIISTSHRFQEGTIQSSDLWEVTTASSAIGSFVDELEAGVFSKQNGLVQDDITVTRISRLAQDKGYVAKIRFGAWPVARIYEEGDYFTSFHIERIDGDSMCVHFLNTDTKERFQKCVQEN